MNISKIKLNLDICNILLKPKGSISSKEFLIGISILLIITFYQTLTENLLTNVSTILNQLNNDLLTITALNITPTAFSLPTNSYFLIFLSCLILCYKRAIDLNYTPIKGIVFGVILYLGFSFNFVGSIKLLTFYTVNDAQVIAKTNNYMTTYNILSVLITLLAIVLVVLLSVKKGKKESFIVDSIMSKYILNLGKTILLFIGFIFVLAILYSFVKLNIEIISMLLGVALLIVLFYYLYLNYKTTKGFRVLFYFNLAILVTYLFALVGYFYITKISVNFAILKLYPSLFTIINMLFILTNLSIISVETSKNNTTNT